MDDRKMTAAEKKRIESLDKRIEKLQDQISEKRREYDTLTDKLQNFHFIHTPFLDFAKILLK